MEDSCRIGEVDSVLLEIRGRFPRIPFGVVVHPGLSSICTVVHIVNVAGSNCSSNAAISRYWSVKQDSTYRAESRSGL